MHAAAPAEGAVRQHESWRVRERPMVEEVRPGLWSIPTSMPDDSLPYITAYAARMEGGLLLVDSGWEGERAWNDLTEGLGAIGYATSDVRMILVTHAHLDHHGLSSRLAAESGAVVGMHPDEARSLEAIRVGMGRDEITMQEWLLARGAPVPEAQSLARELDSHSLASLQRRLADPDFFVGDGDRPVAGRPDIVAIATPGHTPGHLCLLVESERVLLSGDHILPRITPHVTRPPMLDDDALGAYLGSLRKVADLPVDEVLPAHEYRFSGLADRVADLIAHHRERLAEILAVVVAGRTTWDIASRVSWSRGWEAARGWVRHAAVNETYTHLRHLEATGVVRRNRGAPDRWIRLT